MLNFKQLLKAFITIIHVTQKCFANTERFKNVCEIKSTNSFSPKNDVIWKPFDLTCSCYPFCAKSFRSHLLNYLRNKNKQFVPDTKCQKLFSTEMICCRKINVWPWNNFLTANSPIHSAKFMFFWEHSLLHSNIRMYSQVQKLVVIWKKTLILFVTSYFYCSDIWKTSKACKFRINKDK